MQKETPSLTAWRVALRRASHQLVDRPLVFTDPLALRIVGDDGARIVSNPETPDLKFVTRGVRAFMAVRSRYAEDELANAIDRGVRQYVVLGAGLDTFACRNPFPELRVFEVDYPATQSWKRGLIEAAGLTLPASLVFVPIDFEAQALEAALVAAGFNAGEPAFFSWLGVTMYLTLEALTAVLKFVARLPQTSGIVFDYMISPALLGPIQRLAVDAMARRVAAAGEPWTLFFDPADLGAKLRGLGFVEVADLGPYEINSRYFADRSDGLKVGAAGHLVFARV